VIPTFLLILAILLTVCITTIVRYSRSDPTVAAHYRRPDVAAIAILICIVVLSAFLTWLWGLFFG
jgi:hypothetical protein